MRPATPILAAAIIAATTMCTEPLPEPVEQRYGCTPEQQQQWEPCSAQPVRVTGDHRFTTISSGDDHTCGLTSGGVAYCWGSSTDGAAGATSNVRAPQKVDSPVPFTAITAGGSHTCATSEPGAAYCWGSTDATGLTSFPRTCGAAQQCTTIATHVAVSLTFTQLRAGSTHTCGITTDSQVRCWGWNTLGETGAGEPGSSHASPQVITGGPAFQQVESRFRFNCGLTAAGAMHCWGWGQEGQLATTAVPRCALAVMSLLCSSVPVAAATEARFTSIALGGAFGCGLDAPGTIHCWGENGQGQLGRATPGPAVAPIQSSGGSWTSIAAGYFHACALRPDRSAHCWGSNTIGALGTGSTAHSTTTPAPVTGGLQFIQVVAGRDHTCGLTEEGVTWCWGSDRFGQLGRGK